MLSVLCERPAVEMATITLDVLSSDLVDVRLSQHNTVCQL